MPIGSQANHKGGPPTPYPLPNSPLPAQNMTGVGKVPPPEDTSGSKGVQEKDARTRMYRGE
jgi:hypothetical protein